MQDLTLRLRSKAPAGVALGFLLVSGIGCFAEGSAGVTQQSQTGTQPGATSGGQVSSSAPSAPASAHRPGSEFREPDPLDFNEHSGYTQLFDGVSLKGWGGNPDIWRVEDGTLVGESTKEKPSGNSYISYRGIVAKDFDLKLEIKVENGGGSGIQYRSKTGLPWRRARPGDPPLNLNWMMTGPQADFWFPVNPSVFVWTGQFYSENTPLGIIVWRGQVVQSAPGHAQRLIGNIGDRSALGGYVKINDWNQYLIVARGGTFLHVINGQLMAVYIDDDPSSSNNVPGIVGIEIEGTPCKVSVRNVWLKKLS
jgi:hypothetical protein